MKIRITQKGIWGHDGPIPVGTELTLDAVPAHWVNKYEVVTPAPAPDAVPVTNDAPKRGRPRKVQE
jgi:hypothetical protein